MQTRVGVADGDQDAARIDATPQQQRPSARRGPGQIRGFAGHLAGLDLVEQRPHLPEVRPIPRQQAGAPGPVPASRASKASTTAIALTRKVLPHEVVECLRQDRVRFLVGRDDDNVVKLIEAGSAARGAEPVSRALTAADE